MRFSVYPVFVFLYGSLFFLALAFNVYNDYQMLCPALLAGGV